MEETKNQEPSGIYKYTLEFLYEIYEKHKLMTLVKIKENKLKLFVKKEE